MNTPPPSLWIKRILIILLIFHLLILLMNLPVALFCLTSPHPTSTLCQAFEKSYYRSDMELSLKEATRYYLFGLCAGALFGLAAGIMVWGLKRKKPWFFPASIIYTILSLLSSIYQSVFFIDFVLGVILLLLLLRNKEKLQFKEY